MELCIADVLQDWCRERDIDAAYVDPASPWQNGFVESFNGHLRDDFLNLEIFDSMWELRTLLEDQRQTYNHYRPHSSLGYLTPVEFSGNGQDRTGRSTLISGGPTDGVRSA